MIVDDGVVQEIDVPGTPEELFEMFVDPERLVRWIGISATLDPHPGGTFRFEVQPGQFCEGSYVEVERPRRLVFTWGWTDRSFNLPPGSSRVEVDFAGIPTGTRITLTHSGLPGDLRALHDEGWTAFLSRLDAISRAQEPGPYPSGTPEQRREALRRVAESR